MAEVQSLRNRFLSWAGRNPDDDVLRWLLRSLMAATVAVIALDYADLQNAVREKAAFRPSTEEPIARPLPASKYGGGYRTPMRKLDERLRNPMTFDLVADGRLMVTGTIVGGTAELFAAEISKRRSYIKKVVLRSPGGSVRDALAMGRLIRENLFTTEVEAGGYCASSCPLLFAGGVDRRVGRDAAIGVHQVAIIDPGNLSMVTGMEGAQQISAECQKYLRDMGIDLEVWIHAMETPREELYYFRPDELINLKLATTAEGAKSRSAERNQ
jgi:hypothetical protein